MFFMVSYPRKPESLLKTAQNQWKLSFSNMYYFITYISRLLSVTYGLLLWIQIVSSQEELSIRGKLLKMLFLVRKFNKMLNEPVYKY